MEAQMDHDRLCFQSVLNLARLRRTPGQEDSEYPGAADLSSCRLDLATAH